MTLHFSCKNITPITYLPMPIYMVFYLLPGVKRILVKYVALKTRNDPPHLGLALTVFPVWQIFGNSSRVNVEAWCKVSPNKYSPCDQKKSNTKEEKYFTHILFVNLLYNLCLISCTLPICQKCTKSLTEWNCVTKSLDIFYTLL